MKILCKKSGINSSSTYQVCFKELAVRTCFISNNIMMHTIKIQKHVWYIQLMFYHFLSVYTCKIQQSQYQPFVHPIKHLSHLLQYICQQKTHILKKEFLMRYNIMHDKTIYRNQNHSHFNIHLNTFTYWYIFTRINSCLNRMIVLIYNDC